MFYAFMSLVILGCLLNYMSKKYILNKVSYKRKLSLKHLEVGEKFYIASIIENKKFLPITFLQVKEKFPASLQYKFDVDRDISLDCIYHISTMMIMPYQRIKREYEVKFNDRGKYLLRDVTLTAGDFIGLSTISKEIEYGEEIIVYPKAFDINNEIIKIGDFLGDISVMRWIIDDPLVTAGIREYTGFEPEKFIHWPSSLKCGNLMVRNFDHTSDNSVFIILNIECFKPFWVGIEKDSIEKCYSIVRALIEELEDHRIKYGFTTNAQIGNYFNGENYLAPSLGQDHYYNILDSLGSADYSLSVSFEQLINNALSWNINCKTYVLVTPSILQEYVEPINEISVRTDKTAVISIKSLNLDKIKDNIIKCTAEREKS